MQGPLPQESFGDSAVSTWRRRIAASLLLGLLLACSISTSAEAAYCARPFSRQTLFRSEASKDLYNGLAWLGGSIAVQLGTRPETRWTRGNSFDNGIRGGLRSGSRSGRLRASRTTDAMLGVAAGLIPLASIGKTLLERDCDEAYDMTTDWFESISLTVFLTQTIKNVAGRERPLGRECRGTKQQGKGCGGGLKQSFFSGHASMAAAGAGLSCSYAVKRKTWGDGLVARATPCVLGVGAALATGLLRVVADKHWGTDVMVGLAVGAAVGYFDTWGPFDLLRFDVQSPDRALKVRGIVLPYADGNEVGLRMGLTF